MQIRFGTIQTYNRTLVPQSKNTRACWQAPVEDVKWGKGTVEVTQTTACRKNFKFTPENPEKPEIEITVTDDDRVEHNSDLKRDYPELAKDAITYYGNFPFEFKQPGRLAREKAMGATYVPVLPNF